MDEEVAELGEDSSVVWENAKDGLIRLNRLVDIGRDVKRYSKTSDRWCVPFESDPTLGDRRRSPIGRLGLSCLTSQRCGNNIQLAPSIPVL